MARATMAASGGKTQNDKVSRKPGVGLACCARGDSAPSGHSSRGFQRPSVSISGCGGSSDGAALYVPLTVVTY
jgi:hypothetical protein